MSQTEEVMDVADVGENSVSTYLYCWFGTVYFMVSILLNFPIFLILFRTARPATPHHRGVKKGTSKARLKPIAPRDSSFC